MLQVTPQMRVLVAVAAVDFRRGIDGLAQVVREQLSADPFSGGVFVFRNKGRTAVKVLVYDGQGYWLCHKRLSAGRFRHWPTETGGSERSRALLAHELSVLLSGGDFAKVDAPSAWRPVRQA
jgi:transposase